MSAAARPPYRIRFHSRRLQRELDALSHAESGRVREAIEALAMAPRPRGAVHLEDDIFRIRVGRYRIIYRVDDRASLIDIGGIRRRTESTYRRLRDMFAS